METPEENVKTFRRPFFLSLLCISGFVYVGFFLILFILIIVFNDWSANILADYFPEYNITPIHVVFYGILALIFYLLALFGIIYIWKMKLAGYLTLLASLLCITIFPFFIGYGSWPEVIIHSMYLLLIILFLRKFH